MSIGDLIFKMMGQQDPQQQLTAALAGPQGQQPLAGDNAGTPAPGMPATAPAPTGVAPAQGPVASAYHSPPDLSDLYTKLMERQNKNHMIDRGIGLIGSAFAHPENRAAIINAFNDQPQDPIGGIGNILKLQTARTELENRAQMRANLPTIAKKYGLDMDTATYLFNANKLDDVIAQAEKGETSSVDVKDYKYYAQTETQAGRAPISFADWQQKNNRSRTKFSLTPQFSLDADGNVHSYQLSDSGGVQEIKGEDGKPMTKPAVKVDTGTTIEFHNPYNTAEILSVVPKDVAGLTREEAKGKATAASQQILPGIQQAAAKADDVISQIENDPALGTATGMTGTIARRIPGTASYAIEQKINQLKGEAFKQAFVSLKGGGAISDAEGTKATEAIARLDPGMSEDDFRKALAELRITLKKQLVNSAKSAAGDPINGDPTTVGVPADGTTNAPKLDQPRKALIMEDAVAKAKQGYDKAALRERMKHIGFTDEELKDF